GGGRFLQFAVEDHRVPLPRLRNDAKSQCAQGSRVNERRDAERGLPAETGGAPPIRVNQRKENAVELLKPAHHTRTSEDLDRSLIRSYLRRSRTANGVVLTTRAKRSRIQSG